MRKMNSLVMASVVALSTSTALAADYHPVLCQDVLNISAIQDEIFDGIQLTELQRQHMRDLMRWERESAPMLTVKQLEELHQLYTAETFDEAHAEALLQAIAQQDLVHQVRMAKVRNEMYHLLTPEQQKILDQRFERSVAQISGLQ